MVFEARDLIELPAFLVRGSLERNTPIGETPAPTDGWPHYYSDAEPIGMRSSPEEGPGMKN